MTAESKAKELISKFNNSYDEESKSYILYQNVEESKRCALIAVDEIIESHYKVLSGVKPSFYDYWTEVELEIKKL